MHIKEITVKGYKSYANKIVIDSLERGLNIVVGRNGSGKSNFLSALQMILADEESRKKNRQSVIPVLPTAFRSEAGYVEIIFDNQDGFFPEESAEVSLKRCIGAKRDKFFINGKQVERFDKYLTQVGLVTPYAFVQQGRINQLATMHDKDRLELVRVVTGETIWEAILVQILKIRHESDILFHEITDLVKRLTALKPALKEQVKDLAAYSKANDSKRAAEYVFYTRELEKIQKVVAVLEEKKNSVVADLRMKKAKSYAIHEKLEKLTSRASRIKREEKALETQIEVYQTKIQKMTLEIGQLENLLRDYQSVSPEEAAGESLPSNSQRRSLNSLSAKLEKAIGNYSEYEKMLEDLMKQCSRQEIQITQLSEFMTESKGKGFRNEDQRRKYIDSKLAQLQELNAKSQERVIEVQASVTSIEAALDNKRKKLENINIQKEDHIQSISSLSAKISEWENKIRREEAQKQINVNKLTSAEEKIIITKEKLELLYLKMRKPFGSAVMSSYLGMKTVLASLRRREGFDPVANGYYGTVLENLTCDVEFETAVHVAAGQKLFHHIVDSYETGLKLLREYNRLKCCNEVMFITMNRLIHNAVTYPEDNDVTPLITHVQFDARVRPAMEFVFGKVLHCVTSEVASTYAKNHKFTCVTIDGDKISPSGVMSGGYRDRSSNIISLEKSRRESAAKISDLEKEKNAMNEAEKRSKEQLLELAKNLETFVTQKDRENTAVQSTLNSKNARREELRNLERKHETEVQNLNRLKKAQTAAEDNIKYFKEITATIPNISAEEFHGLNVTLKSTLAQVKECQDKLKAAKKKRNSIEKELEMVKKTDKLSDSYVTDPSLLPDMKQRLKAQTEQKIHSIDESISTHEDEVRQYQSLLLKLKDEAKNDAEKREKLQDEITEQKDKARDLEKELAITQAKIFEEQHKYHKANEFLREIGSYPIGVADYSTESTSRLIKIIKNSNKYIAGKDTINHRAKEQFDDVRALVEKFKQSGKYFGTVENWVTKILQKIEDDKSEICVQTVRGVQESFRKIFQELVLKATGIRGYGRFILYGDSVEFTETNRLEDGKAWWETKEFEGASLKVSFKDWGDQPMQLTDILQLSGGQKSIVALSFLLAIQQANPQSLYVFDEVDQALDPSFRQAVAQKMKEMSNNAQFLCTTFRKEFIEYADAFLGVSYRNQKSHVKPVSREEALDFVQPESDGSSTSFDESAIPGSGTELEASVSDLHTSE